MLYSGQHPFTIWVFEIFVPLPHGKPQPSQWCFSSLVQEQEALCKALRSRKKDRISALMGLICPHSTLPLPRNIPSSHFFLTTSSHPTPLPIFPTTTKRCFIYFHCIGGVLHAHEWLQTCFLRLAIDKIALWVGYYCAGSPLDSLGMYEAALYKQPIPICISNTDKQLPRFSDTVFSPPYLEMTVITRRSCSSVSGTFMECWSSCRHIGQAGPFGGIMGGRAHREAPAIVALNLALAMCWPPATGELAPCPQVPRHAATWYTCAHCRHHTSAAAAPPPPLLPPIPPVSSSGRKFCYMHPTGWGHQPNILSRFQCNILCNILLHTEVRVWLPNERAHCNHQILKKYFLVKW